MKMILFFLFSLLCLTSCGIDSRIDEITNAFEQDEKIVEESIEVNLGVGESYTYNTGLSGDEDDAFILVDAENASISNIFRNASTDFVAIYNYTPSAYFEGTDSVELQFSLGGAGQDIITRIIKITFIISQEDEEEFEDEVEFIGI